LTGPLGHDVLGADHGPPLILGSPLGTTRDMWDPQRAVLSERSQVIGYDHLGHGTSPVPLGPISLEELGRAVLGLADHLGVRRFHYAGLSLGGMVGMWLAINAAERVDRLVLLCTSAHLPRCSTTIVVTSASARQRKELPAVPVQRGPDLGDTQGLPDPRRGRGWSPTWSPVPPAGQGLGAGQPATRAHTTLTSAGTVLAGWSMRISPPTRVAGMGSFPSRNHRYAVTGCTPFATAHSLKFTTVSDHLLWSHS
jgi:pimeloyl-ACP methyl ester carboxylesterase